MRGTGKSSLVRALLAAHAPRGLRLVQVDKDDLVMPHDIVDGLRDQPYRFILFADDVSFEPGESSYKALKSALDGSVYAVPENVLIHVTSNRRHLLPEFETDNRGALMVNDEIHHGEAIEEKISLSGRFGLWVGFTPSAPSSTWRWSAVDRPHVRGARDDAAVGRPDRTPPSLGPQEGDASGRIAWQSRRTGWAASRGPGALHPPRPGSRAVPAAHSCRTTGWPGFTARTAAEAPSPTPPGSGSWRG